MINKDIIKKILKESSDNDSITRIAVFDFDNTLIDSPEPEIGRTLYKEKTGNEWPHRGWWGRPESLDMDIFDMSTIPSVIADYKNEKSKGYTLLVLLTGRITKLSNEVEKILSSKGLKFDEYHYNNGGSTLDFKIKTLDDLINRYPNVKSISLWDDRDEHIPSFQAWGNNLEGIDFNITHVK